MASATKADDPRAVSEDPSSLSAGSKARFNKFAKRDEETGELYLGRDEFIDAIAPIDEDYVRSCRPTSAQMPVPRGLQSCVAVPVSAFLTLASCSTR